MRQMECHWYALQIKPRSEKIVEANLQNKGYETFLPMNVIRRRWSDRMKAISVPLFPGYAFCRFDLNARLPILVTPGVQSIVGAGRLPMAVDEDEIEAIRQVVNSGIAAQPWPYLNVGQVVEIEEGPLQGLQGIVVRVKNIERLVVSVSLLMRSVAVELDREALRPIRNSRPSNDYPDRLLSIGA